MLNKINLTINWLEARLRSCAWILVANTLKQWTVSGVMMKQSTVYRETQQCLKSCRNLRGNRRSRLCFRGCVWGLNSLCSVVWCVENFEQHVLIFSLQEIDVYQCRINSCTLCSCWSSRSVANVEARGLLHITKATNNGETFVRENSCHTLVVVEQHLFAVSGTLSIMFSSVSDWKEEFWNGCEWFRGSAPHRREKRQRPSRTLRS